MSETKQKWSWRDCIDISEIEIHDGSEKPLLSMNYKYGNYDRKQTTQFACTIVAALNGEQQKADLLDELKTLLGFYKGITNLRREKLEYVIKVEKLISKAEGK